MAGNRLHLAQMFYFAKGSSNFFGLTKILIKKSLLPFSRVVRGQVIPFACLLCRSE
jgi:hypothetical protein